MRKLVAIELSQTYVLGFIFLLLIYMPLFDQANAVALTGKICLNEDGIRELDFDYTVGVQEFDELNKKVVVTIDVSADDEYRQTEPFDVYHRRYPYLGSSVIHVISKDTEFYRIEPNTIFTESRITPIPNFPINLWPFETYKIPMFLEFDRDVKLCYNTFADGSSDVSAYKAAYFPENPDWEVEITPREVTLAELQELVPDIEPKFENSTFFQFDTKIYHTEDYIGKNVFYFIVPLVPILLIIGHGFLIKFEELNVHITFFAGVSILILTSLFAIRPFTPIDLTLLETISLSGIAAYAVGFFVFLISRYRRTWKKRTPS